jgi:hypothetical protein
MVNTYSKSLHFGRKLWGEFEKPTPEVPILAIANDFCLVGTVPFDTGLTQKEQFNRTPPVRQRRTVLQQGIARQTLGRYLTLAHNVVRGVL